MINVAELIVEARENLIRDQELAYQIMLNEKVEMDIIALLESQPILMLLVSSSYDSVKVIQTICMLCWETGRLYGRQEIVRETVGD